MDMEVAPQYLTALSVTYDKANSLGGDAHRKAFIGIFCDTLNMMRCFVGDARRATLAPLQRRLFRGSTSAEPESLDLGSFWQGLDQVAVDLYESVADEHVLTFESDRVWNIQVGTDPIFFSIGPKTEETESRSKGVGPPKSLFFEE